MATIGYARIGRAMPLSSDRWGVVGGDMEPPRLLTDLALRHPDDRFVITSLCRDDPQRAGLPPNVVNSWTPQRLEWMREVSRRENKGAMTASDIERKTAIMDELTLPVFAGLDAVIVWAGQHGTSNSRIRTVSDRGGEPDGLTKPQDSFVIYAGPTLRGINHWREVDPIAREEVWLIADVRNHIKCRDLKWPLRFPVLGQYDFKRKEQHERYDDKRMPQECGFGGEWATDHTWRVWHHYRYSQLEVCSITPEHLGVQCSYEHQHRSHFGIFINEARSYVKLNRRDIVKEWVLPLEPAFLHGQWPDDHEQELGRKVTVAPFEHFYPLMQSVLCTFTTPSSGSGWATTKPWEAFLAGTVCFFHPNYDDQNHILGDAPAELRDWLRVSSPEDLRKRVTHLWNDRTAWLWLVTEQRKLYDQAMQERRWIKMIEERVWG